MTDGSADDLDESVNGSIQTSWFVNPDDSVNSIFQVTATGLSSGNAGNSQFTDGYYVTRFYDPFSSGTASTSYWEYRDVEPGNSFISFDANDRELRSGGYSFASSDYTAIRINYQVWVPPSGFSNCAGIQR